MSKKKGIIAEFKEFISRGNVIDLAVGVVMGSAFTAIVTSLVNDIIMPAVGVLFGGIDFTSLRLVIREATELQRRRQSATATLFSAWLISCL